MESSDVCRPELSSGPSACAAFTGHRDALPSMARTLSSSSLRALEHRVENLFIKRVNSRCQEQWSQSRRNLAVIVDSVAIEVVIAVLILVNLVFSIVATDAEAAGLDAPAWMDTCMFFIVVAYCAEIALRIYVLRWEYFKSTLNVFDLVIVAADLITLAFAAVSAGKLAADNKPVRLVRVIRLFRAVRILFLFRSLYILMKSMASAMAAVVWALLMISLALTMCSVFAVEVIQPYILELAATTDTFEDCPRCMYAYSSVWRAYVTFFQTIVAADAWGEIAVPVMDAHPWTGLFFITSWLFIQLCLINMILAVIVDKAHDARESNSAIALAVKDQRRREALREMEFIFADMDKDCSGELSLDEILEGFDQNQAFKDIIQLMDVGKEDLRALFTIMDQDKSGTCTYKEFVDALWKMKTQNTHTLLVFIKSYVLDVKYSLEESMNWLKSDINTRLAELRSKHEGGAGVHCNMPSRLSVSSGEPPPTLQEAKAPGKYIKMKSFRSNSSMSSTGSTEPPPCDQEVRAAERDKRPKRNSDDGLHCNCRSRSPASSREPPPPDQEARVADEWPCTGLRDDGTGEPDLHDFPGGTAAMDAAAVSGDGVISLDCMEADIVSGDGAGGTVGMEADAISGDGAVGTACMQTTGASIPRLLSLNSQRADASSEAPSKMFEAPPTSVPAELPAVAITCKRRGESHCGMVSQEMRGAQPCQGMPVKRSE